MIPFWTDKYDRTVASNYHFCPDYELDLFFNLTYIGWVDPNFDDFPDLSDLDSFFQGFKNLTVLFSPNMTADNVVDTLILLEWFF